MITSLKKVSGNLIADMVACLFILLFVYAASSKLWDLKEFKSQVSLSPLLTSFPYIVIIAIPTVELLLCALLFFQKTRLTALYGSFGLMVMFSTYIIVITRFSDYVPCSCGGILQNMTWNQHLLFNLTFVLFGAAAVLVYPPVINR